jgi:hypothetical protein
VGIGRQQKQPRPERAEYFKWPKKGKMKGKERNASRCCGFKQNIEL